MTAVPQLRIPPHSTDAECGVLGALLIDGEALGRIPDLKTEDFYRHEHKAIFRAIHAQAGAGQSFDVLTTWDWLVAHGEDEQGQLLPYLNSVAQTVPSAGYIRRHAAIVQEKALLRAIVTAADDTAAAAFGTTGKSPAELLDAAQMRFAKLAAIRVRRDPQHITESLSNYLGLLQELSEGKNPALPTGIVGLDRLLHGGLRRGEMMVLGARPKHGKTALSLAMARNMARDYSVLFISQEMSVTQLMHRHTAAMGTADLGRILAADPSDRELWTRVGEATERLGKLHLTHDEEAAQSLMTVRRKAIKVKRERGLDVLFVDFLQLMQGAGQDENRNRELDTIANGIKALGMDLECAVVLMSQMSRKADEHYGRPTMTHLRDSGAIEAAADQVVVMFTDHAHPLSPKLKQFVGYSEIEIVAHRNGPQGVVPLHFAGQYQQITDWGGELPQRPKSSNKTKRGMSDDDQ